MSQFSIRRVVVAVFLGLLLTSSIQAGEAREREDRLPRARVSGVVFGSASKVWDFLGRLWAKEGCGIDPHGGCTPDPITTASPEQDAGCGLDPHGSCGQGK
jgi:hypothetical protein